MMCFLSKSVLLLSNKNNNMCASAVWRKTEKTKVEIFIIGVSEEEKEERFLKKKQRRASTLSSLNLLKELSKASQ